MSLGDYNAIWREDSLTWLHAPPKTQQKVVKMSFLKKKEKKKVALNLLLGMELKIMMFGPVPELWSGRMLFKPHDRSENLFQLTFFGLKLHVIHSVLHSDLLDV